MPGVTQTKVGYTGGWTQDPTYSSVCAGDGHSEALRIEFDASQVSYGDLLQTFFANHKPSKDQMIAQYQSIIFTSNAEQETQAKKALQTRGQKVATTVRPQRRWWDAEENHQKFVAKQEAWAAQLQEQQKAREAEQAKKKAAAESARAKKRAKAKACAVEKEVQTALKDSSAEERAGFLEEEGLTALKESAGERAGAVEKVSATARTEYAEIRFPMALGLRGVPVIVSL